MKVDPEGASTSEVPQAGSIDALQVRMFRISDLNLGTPGCQAQALQDFLQDATSNTLYLVGDLIDGGQLRRRRDFRPPGPWGPQNRSGTNIPAGTGWRT